MLIAAKNIRQSCHQKEFCESIEAKKFQTVNASQQKKKSRISQSKNHEFCQFVAVKYPKFCQLVMERLAIKLIKEALLANHLWGKNDNIILHNYIYQIFALRFII